MQKGFFGAATLGGGRVLNPDHDCGKEDFLREEAFFQAGCGYTEGHGGSMIYMAAAARR